MTSGPNQLPHETSHRLIQFHADKFLSASTLATAAVCVRGDDAKTPRILLRSSWQTVNIGDIAHTPGMLRLLEEHIPSAEVTLWPNALSADVEKMLKTRFPKLNIASDAEAKKSALETCDFFLHGSGPGMVGAKEAARWKETKKPYGFGGITLQTIT